MSVAEATPDYEQGSHEDRAFLGHPKGLGYLGFTEGCERFSYYSMQTLLTLYLVGYLLVLHVGDFDVRSMVHVPVLAAGALVLSLHAARHFGQFHGGNEPEPSAKLKLDQ